MVCDHNNMCSNEIREPDMEHKNGTKFTLKNKNLKNMDQDVLYHLGLDTSNYNLPEMFGDVKFICMGGTKLRMREFARHIAEVLDISVPEKIINLTKHSQRYAMYKVGPVIAVSHGIGIPSMTTVLQELLKLVHYAGVQDPIFFRIGTSGGLNVPPGSVVVSSWCLSGTLEYTYDIPILGKLRKLPSYFDQSLCQEISSLSSEGDGFQIFIGGTMAADDFYRGQARTDGPFCDYTEEDKLSFLSHLSSLGVKNIEMEATAFAAYTCEAGVRATDVCVTLVDRLKGDQVLSSKATMMEWQNRPITLIGKYIAQYMQK